MATINNVNNGDTGLNARNKINNNFGALNTAKLEKSSIATEAEVQAGTENTKFITALRLLQGFVHNAGNYVFSALNTTSKTIVGAINELRGHVIETNNPHSVTKSQVGLGNVDNTSDANKPVSTAQQAEFDSIDLQSPYNNSTDGKIQTDSTRGAVKLQAHSDAANVQEWLNQAGSVVASVKGDGTPVFKLTENRLWVGGATNVNEEAETLEEWKTVINETGEKVNLQAIVRMRSAPGIDVDLLANQKIRNLSLTVTGETVILQPQLGRRYMGMRIRLIITSLNVGPAVGSTPASISIGNDASRINLVANVALSSPTLHRIYDLTIAQTSTIDIGTTGLIFKVNTAANTHDTLVCKLILNGDVD